MTETSSEASVKRRPLLFLTQAMAAYGGGSCVTAWALQALESNWDVTILCASRPDFAGIDRHFGTALEGKAFTIWQLPFPLRHLHRLDPDPFSVQRLAWMMRFCRARSDRYDVVVSCDDELDFGRPGVSYTHFPYLTPHLATLRRNDEAATLRRFGRMLTGSCPPWMFISGIRLSSLRSNQMICNSQWTADHTGHIYDVEPKVLYPPVVWRRPVTDWRQRRFAFVAIGRLSPSKRYLEMIDILERVRARGFGLEFEIIGDPDRLARDAYVNHLRSRIERAGDWCRLHVSVSRDRLEELVSGCRFGLHGLHDEHFGIAPAEMLRAGCVVFVPNSGGQTEIVNADPALVYDSDDQAVDKICRLLADEAEQERVRRRLQTAAERFSEERFMAGFRDIVKEFADGR
ncbi:glycosyltransferase family 4 protein [Elongatibacter sediminis]|uniref:Glycosyltransferase family 4 protein n=1 Tax=Elongatibacter sediminis TaxID=3119006 RepID=A0AAW9R8W7_9GAMM